MSKRFVLLAALVFLAPALFLSAEEGYYSRSYARLSYIQGDVSIQRGGDLGYESGVVNLPLTEGDRLGTREGRAEVQFGLQNYLRIDRFTQVDMANLPQQDYDPYKLHLLGGNAYLRVSRMDQEKMFEIHTPDVSFYVLSEGLYRIDIRENRETELRVLEGEAEAAGEAGSVVVRAGERIVASNGRLSSNPEFAYAGADDFSRFNESRDALLARRVSRSYLSSDLYEYESELDEYGTWSYMNSYGYVWVPRHMYYGWQPYTYGRWVWYPIIGWTWVPYEPWGWCTFHYGRWHWDLGLGWYWIPSYHWGPAWVHWWWDYDYIGWCPLNYWNRPVVIVNNYFYNNYHGTNSPVHNRALSVIRRDQLQAHRISDVVLDRASLSGIAEVSLSARQPDISPTIARSGAAYGEAARTFAGARVRDVQGRFESGRQSLGATGRLAEPLRSGDRTVSRSSAATPFDARRGDQRSVSGDLNRAWGSRASGSVSGRAGDNRNIRSFPSRGTTMGRSSIGSSDRGLAVGRNARSSSSSRSMPSSGAISSRGSSSQVRASSREYRSTSAPRTSDRAPAIREYSPGRSSSTSTRSISGSSSRTHESRNRSIGSTTDRRVSSYAPSTSSRSGSSIYDFLRPRTQDSSRGSSADRIPRYSAPSTSRSSGSSIPRFESPSRSYSSSSRDARSYSVPPRSYSRPSYSAPSRSYSSPSRSYSSPSRSYSSPSRSFSSSSRSNSRPSVSGRSSGSFRSSSSSSSRSSSRSSSSSSRSVRRSHDS